MEDHRGITHWYRVFFTSAPQYSDPPQSILGSLHADFSMFVCLILQTSLSKDQLPTYFNRPVLMIGGEIIIDVELITRSDEKSGRWVATTSLLAWNVGGLPSERCTNLDQK